MTRENKVNFGLKNVHYATFEEVNGKIVYDTPIPMPGAIELELEPRGELTEFYADDMLYYSAATNQGYNGKLTIANIQEDFAINCLGEEKNEADGVITEKTTAKGKPFAYLFEFDGDIKATRHVLFNCSANRPTVSSSTKTDTSEPNENELTFISSPRSTDYAVKSKTSATTSKEVYDNWYNTVYGEIIDNTPLTLSTTPQNAATNIVVTSSIVFTFNKEVKVRDIVKENFIILDAAGAEVPGTLSLDINKKIVTFKPSSNLKAATKYTVIATKNISDLKNNTLSETNVISFTTV